MGVFEILIVLAIALVVFGSFFRKQLPQIGRSAGRGARVGGEKAKELADQVGEKAGDKFDPAAMGRSAGKGVREAREFRDSFKGTLDATPKTEERPAPRDPSQDQPGNERSAAVPAAPADAAPSSQPEPNGARAPHPGPTSTPDDPSPNQHDPEEDRR